MENFIADLEKGNFSEHVFLKIEDSFRNYVFKILKSRYSHLTLDKLLKVDSHKVKVGKNLWNFPSFLHACKLVNIDVSYAKNFIKGIRKGRRGEILKCLTINNDVFHNLAELVGHAMGDGTIPTLSSRFYYYNKNLALFWHVCKILKNTFGDIKIYKRKRKGRSTYELCTSSTIGHILSICGAPVGRKVVKDFFVPEWILHGDVPIKKSFLRALFDDEGDVKKGKITLRVSKHKELKTSFLNFLEQVRKMLLDLGLNHVTIKVHDENEERVRGIIYYWT